MPAPKLGRFVPFPLKTFSADSPRMSGTMRMRRSVGVIGLALAAIWSAAASYAQQATGTALIRHAPTLNGDVEGSIQQMTAESATLNGGASVTGAFLLPGTPTAQLNGNPSYGGPLDGTGAATPPRPKITLNRGASLRHVWR